MNDGCKVHHIFQVNTLSKSLLDNAPNYLVGPKEIIAQWAKIRKQKKKKTISLPQMLTHFLQFYV